MKKRVKEIINQLDSISWEDHPLIEVNGCGILPLKRRIEKLPDYERTDLLEITEGIESTLQRLHVSTPKELQRPFISDEFNNLAVIGQYLKLLHQAASHSDGDISEAFEDTVMNLCEKGVYWLNEGLESLYEKFEEIKSFEPIRLD